jgi:hypothetical protein
MRVLCAREIQKSMKDSVHKLLSDQIASLGLAGHYQVLNDEIRGRNGTEFVFAGLRHNVDSIKSKEGHRLRLGRRGADGQQDILGQADPDDPQGRVRNLGDVQSRARKRRDLSALRARAARRRGRRQGQLVGQSVVS